MISVIVRTIGSAWLGDALESLAAQTRHDFEIVIVCLGVRWREPPLSKRRLSPPHSKILELPLLSRPAALNAGIAAASGDIIAILDEDNLYDPNQIDIFSKALESTGAGWVYCGVRHSTYTKSGEWLASHDTGRPFSFDALLHENFIYATGSAFRKDLWQQLGGYDERFDVLEDWEFLIRVAQIAPVVYLDRVAGESRKFTGVIGASSFERNLAQARRCHAAIRWKHRRIYLGRDRATGVSLPRVIARAVRVVARVLPWFVHNGRNAARPHRS